MFISLLGFDFVCPNKGCEALSYSFIDKLDELIDEEITIYNITYKESLGEFPKVYKNIKFIEKHLSMKNPITLLNAYCAMKKSDFIFDITYGDSFSDIYGKKWLKQTNFLKKLALKTGNKFILLPQTYGPFDDEELKRESLKIIKSSSFVFSRDQKSIDYLKQNGINNVKLSTDLAMSLKFHKVDLKTHKNIGINISSLLWENGFTKNNEFGLSVDYKKYSFEVVERCLKNGWNVYLIPHVIEDVNGSPENDLRALREIKKVYPNVNIVSDVTSPIELKSYISSMDCFIGARMHSTIAAFSSSVAVIPFSYSRKFEGLYGNLNYNYVINGRKESTESATEKTMMWISKYNELKEQILESQIEMKKNQDVFKEQLRALLNNTSN